MIDVSSRIKSLVAFPFLQHFSLDFFLNLFIDIFKFLFHLCYLGCEFLDLSFTSKSEVNLLVYKGSLVHDLMNYLKSISLFNFLLWKRVFIFNINYFRRHWDRCFKILQHIAGLLLLFSREFNIIFMLLSL